MNEVHPFWLLVTRLAEAQILLPCVLLLCWWVAHRADARPLVQRWLAAIALAAAVTTVTKVAFMGWGIGSAALNFTGVSGHAMFAAAVYPPLLSLGAAGRSPTWRRVGWLAGVALALLIALSRVMTGAHSWSEVIAGVALGTLASVSALWLARWRHARMPLWLPAGIAFWLVFMPVQAPASVSHALVTRLALALSGRSQPHTRADLLQAAASNEHERAPLFHSQNTPR